MERMISPSEILNIFPILQAAPDQVKEELFAKSIEASLDELTTIWDEGDVCTNLALVLSGEARVFKLAENGREITLYRISPGESCILTASCMMSQTNFPAYAKTETPVKALAIPAEIFRGWVNQYPLWQEYLFGLLSRRVAAIISVVEEVAFKRVDSRIATYLLSGNKAEIRKTHYEIASEVGTSREVVSRILKDLEKQKTLSLSRGFITINNSLELEKISQRI